MLLPPSSRVPGVRGPNSKTWYAIHAARPTAATAATATAVVRHGSIARSGGRTRLGSIARHRPRRPRPSSGRANAPAAATAISGGRRPTSAPLPWNARWPPSARASAATARSIAISAWLRRNGLATTTSA